MPWNGTCGDLQFNIILQCVLCPSCCFCSVPGGCLADSIGCLLLMCCLLPTCPRQGNAWWIISFNYWLVTKSLFSFQFSCSPPLHRVDPLLKLKRGCWNSKLPHYLNWDKKQMHRYSPFPLSKRNLLLVIRVKSRSVLTIAMRMMDIWRKKFNHETNIPDELISSTT